MSKSDFSVCVFCGSRSGSDPEYHRAATELGAQIAKQDWRLVYGAGDIGLMGGVAEAAIRSGAETLGVIPTHLVNREAPRGIYENQIVTENMHERKKVMFMNSDAVFVLPGGAGSLDEFFEVLTWAQLGLHSKPIIVLNIANYWEPLIHLVDHIIETGFADPSLRNHFEVADSVAAAVARISGN